MFSKLNNKYPEAFFIAKLVTLFSIFYFGTEFWIGITAKGGLYIPFCDNYLNYVRGLRLLILNGASLICLVFGYKTTIIDTISLKIIGGYQVNMVYSCIGYGLLSCWAAFIIAYPSKKKRKLIWLLGGLIAIYFANIIRVAGLLIVVNKTKNVARFANHHEIFNAVAYSIIILLLYIYTKNEVKNPTKSK
jgi:exosortase/archaeosortase family protein